MKVVKRKQRYRLMKRSGIKDIDQMQGYQFEEYLKVLFKGLGYRPIVTKKSGDYGADVVLKGRNKIVIQAKRYGYKHNVSMDAVREVFASMFFYKADEAWVITNSFFTKQAMILAKACGVKLLNRYELEEFIVKINPAQQPKQFTRKRSDLH
ncbi:restriction endonuclease [Virgibacillus phasianinus]|uniref:Restriction endonuclease n=2 Tax=Virgibacillus phasianinus TaxID=2017483 RepID=A0A220U8W3_9BACI|nr:restriction endonuclease [Virgibacillus phasianinus]